MSIIEYHRQVLHYHELKTWPRFRPVSLSLPRYVHIQAPRNEKKNILNSLFPTFRVAEALILGTMMVGQATAFAPNYNKAVLASARVFKLLDRKPLIDGDGESGIKLVSF